MGERSSNACHKYALADEMFIATPAIANGKIYLRGQNTLFCIGQ
jgi:hypothetical protein